MEYEGDIHRLFPGSLAELIILHPANGPPPDSAIRSQAIAAFYLPADPASASQP